MPATAAQGQGTKLGEGAQFWSAVKQWLRDNSGAVVKSAILGALFGYCLNFAMSMWLFGGGFDGSQSGVGNLLKNSLITGILSTVIFALIGYRRSVGKERFWRDVRSAAKTIALLFQQDGAAAWVHLLWGAGISFIAAQFISPWLGAALALGFLTAVPSMFGRVIAALLLSLWSSIVQSFAPTKGQRVERSVGMLVGIVGSACALGIGGLIVDTRTKLVLAGGCMVAAFVMRRRGAGATVPLILIGLATLLGQILYDLLHPLTVLADHCVRGETPGCHEPVVFDWSGAPNNQPRPAASDPVGAAVSSLAPGGAAGLGGAAGTVISAGAGEPAVGGRGPVPVTVSEDPDDPGADEPVRIEPIDLSRDGAKLPGEDSDIPFEPSTEDINKRKRIDEALRIATSLIGLRGHVPSTDLPIIDRILGRIDLTNPSDADLNTLRGLVRAMTNKSQGAVEFREASEAEAAAKLAIRGLEFFAGLGQAATAVLLFPKAGIFASGVAVGGIFGALGGLNFNQKPVEVVANSAIGALFGAGLAAIFGGVGLAAAKPLGALGNKLGLPEWLPGAAFGGAIGAGTGAFGSWWAGEKPEDIKANALWSGLGAALTGLIVGDPAKAWADHWAKGGTMFRGLPNRRRAGQAPPRPTGQSHLQVGEEPPPPDPRSRRHQQVRKELPPQPRTRRYRPRLRHRLGSTGLSRRP